MICDCKRISCSLCSLAAAEETVVFPGGLRRTLCLKASLNIWTHTSVVT